MSKVLKTKTEDGKKYVFVKYEHYPISLLAFQNNVFYASKKRKNERKTERKKNRIGIIIKYCFEMHPKFNRWVEAENLKLKNK